MDPFAFNAGDRWLILMAVIFEAGLKSVVLLLFAALAVACLRKSSAAVRHMVWFMAMVSLPLLPLLSWVLPAWHILPASITIAPSSRNPSPILRPALPLPEFAPETAPQKVARAEEAKEVLSPSTPSAEVQVNSSPANHQLEAAFPPPAPATTTILKATAPVRDSVLRPTQWASLAWLGGFLLFLLPLILGVVSLGRLSKFARLEGDSEWLNMFRTLLEKLALRRKVILLKSSQRGMPMTWGILHPKVLLPEVSSEWSEARRRVVLLHELAHVTRWDYATNVISQIVCSLYWFNPLVWLAARLLMMERERACDDVVLQQGAQPADYAQQILEVAAALPKVRWSVSAGIPMARASQLESRLRAILDGKRNRQTISRTLVFTAFILLCVGLVPVSMMKAQVTSKSVITIASSNPSATVAAVTTEANARLQISEAAKTPEQMLSDFQKMLPNGWSTKLVYHTAEDQSSPGRVEEYAFHIVFQNPQLWTDNIGDPHLALHFYPSKMPLPKFLQGIKDGEDFQRMLFTETNEYMVVLSMDWMTSHIRPSLIRSIAPIGRMLVNYFGVRTDQRIFTRLGIGRNAASTHLAGSTGFEGIVLDEETGHPVPLFKLEFDPPDLATATVSMEGSPPLEYFDGKFVFDGQLPSDKKRGSPEWNGENSWKTNILLTGRVQAEGYLPAPLLPEPVVWPVRMTNIVVRLKKSNNSGTTMPLETKRDPSKSLQRQSELGDIQGTLRNITSGDAVTQYWVQHGLKTKSGETNWSQYYEARIANQFGGFSLPRESLAQVWRILTIANEPYVVTSQEFDANWSNFVLRLKLAQQLRGMVLDHTGHPVEGVSISVTNVETRLDLVKGLAFALGCNSTTTDAQGKFVLPRPSGTKMKIIAISPDRHMIQPALISDDARDVQITFPQPATLSMNYDIPGDTALPSMGMALATFEKDAVLWKGVEYIVTSPLTNGSKTILSNLTPGRYNFLRGHQAANGTQGARIGLDSETFTLTSGQTHEKNMIRTNGFRIRGIVLGMEATGATEGRVRIGTGPSGNTTVDDINFGKDGRFQTVILPPGKYSVQGGVLPPQVDPTKSKVGTSQGGYAGFSAAMVVTLTRTAPEEVQLKLLESSAQASEAKREEIRRDMLRTNASSQTASVSGSQSAKGSEDSKMISGVIRDPVGKPVLGATISFYPGADAPRYYEESKMISGIIRDSAGKPVPDAIISFYPGAYDPHYFFARTNTDDRGNFQLLLRMDPRSYAREGWPPLPKNFILVSSPTQNLAAIQILPEVWTTPLDHLMASGGKEMVRYADDFNLNVQLVPGIKLSGSVKNIDAVAAGDAGGALSFTFQGSRFILGEESIRVDKNGNFSLPSLPRGLAYWFENGFGSQAKRSAQIVLSEENSNVDHYQFPPFILE